MSKFNEQHAVTMLNALIGTETLENFEQQIRAEALEDLKNNILKGINEDTAFANTKIKDANWEEYIKVLLMK